MSQLIKYKANGMSYDVERFSFLRTKQRPVFLAEEIEEYKYPAVSPMMQLSLKFEPFYKSNAVMDWYRFDKLFTSFPGFIARAGASFDEQLLAEIIPKLRESVDEEFLSFKEYEPVPPEIAELVEDCQPQVVESKCNVSLPLIVSEQSDKRAVQFSISIQSCRSILEICAKHRELKPEQFRLEVSLQQLLSSDDTVLEELTKIQQNTLFHQLSNVFLYTANDFLDDIIIAGETVQQQLYLKLLLEYNGYFCGECLFFIDFKYQNGQQELLFMKIGDKTHTAAVSYEIEFDDETGNNIMRKETKLLFPIINSQLLERNNRFIPFPDTDLYLKQGGNITFLCHFEANITNSTPFQIDFSYLPNQLFFEASIEQEKGQLMFISNNYEQLANFGAYFLDFGEETCEVGQSNLLCYAHLDFVYQPGILEFCELYGGSLASQRMTGIQMIVQIVGKVEQQNILSDEYLVFRSACFRYYFETVSIEKYLMDTTIISKEMKQLIDYYEKQAQYLKIKDSIDLPPFIETAAAKVETAFLQPPSSQKVFSMLGISSIANLQFDLYENIHENGVNAHEIDISYKKALQNNFYDLFCLSYNSDRIFGNMVDKSVNMKLLLLPELEQPINEIFVEISKEVTMLILDEAHLTTAQKVYENIDVFSYYNGIELSEEELLICRFVIMLKFLNSLLIVEGDNYEEYCGCLHQNSVEWIHCDISSLLISLLSILQQNQLQNSNELIEVIATSFELLCNYENSFIELIPKLSKDILLNQQFEASYKLFFSKYLEINKDKECNLDLFDEILALKLQKNYFSEVIQPYYVYSVLQQLRNEEILSEVSFSNIFSIKFEGFDCEELKMTLVMVYYLINRSDNAEGFKSVVSLFEQIVQVYTEYEVQYDLIQEIITLIFRQIQKLKIPASSDIAIVLCEILDNDVIRECAYLELFEQLYIYTIKQVTSLNETNLQLATRLMNTFLNNAACLCNHFKRFVINNFSKIIENDLTERKFVLFVAEQIKGSKECSVQMEFYQYLQNYNEVLQYFIVNEQQLLDFFDNHKLEQKFPAIQSPALRIQSYYNENCQDMLKNLFILESTFLQLNDPKFHFIIDITILALLRLSDIRALIYIKQKQEELISGLPDIYFALRILYKQRQHLVLDQPEVGCFPVDSSLFPNFPISTTQNLRQLFINYCNDCKLGNFILEQDIETINRYFSFEQTNSFKLALEQLPECIIELRNCSTQIQDFRQLQIYLPTHYDYFSMPEPIPDSASFRNNCIQASFRVNELPKLEKCDLCGEIGLQQLQYEYLEEISDFIKFSLSSLRKLVLCQYNYNPSVLSASLQGVLTCWLCDSFIENSSKHIKDVVEWFQIAFFDEEEYGLENVNYETFELKVKEKLFSVKICDIGLVFQNLCIAGKNLIFSTTCDLYLIEIPEADFSNLCIKALLLYGKKENMSALEKLIPDNYVNYELANQRLIQRLYQQYDDYGLEAEAERLKIFIVSDVYSDSGEEEAECEEETEEQ